MLWEHTDQVLLDDGVYTLQISSDGVEISVETVEPGVNTLGTLFLQGVPGQLRVTSWKGPHEILIDVI